MTTTSDFTEALERVEALLAKTTATLPWKLSPWHVEEGPSAVRCSAGWIVANTASDTDAELIAEAVNLLPALVAAVRGKDEALRAILYLRPSGPCRNKMIEQMENIARDALHPSLPDPQP